MSYELTLSIPDDSPQGHNIDAMAEAEQISREEAALRLLANSGGPVKASAAARRILGVLGSPEDASIMDEALEIGLADREHRNAQPPHA